MAVILSIDPGYGTGICVVDTSAKPNGKVLWHKTVTGGWKRREAIADFVQDAIIFGYDTDHILPSVVLIQNPMAQEKIPIFGYSGGKSPISLAKNIGLSCYIYGALFGMVNIKIKLVPPQRGKGMKMDKDLFYRLHPEVKLCSGHVRDAANMALGYNEIGG